MEMIIVFNWNIMSPLNVSKIFKSVYVDDIC